MNLCFSKAMPLIVGLLLCSTEEGHSKNSRKHYIYDQAVSLGSTCQVAFQLAHNGIRHEAFPFDWIVSRGDGVAAFIANRGSHFLDWDKMEFHGEYAGHPPFHYVVDTHYGFISLHDFLGPWDFDHVKEKYQRRVARFFQLLKSKKKVLFIRIETTRKEVEYLDHIIHTLYPKLRFSLVALNNSEDFKIDWGHPRIRNFYIDIENFNWQGDFDRWKEIMRQFFIQPIFNKELINDIDIPVEMPLL